MFEGHRQSVLKATMIAVTIVWTALAWGQEVSSYHTVQAVVDGLRSAQQAAEIDASLMTRPA
jgi:hypothetical protein